MLPSGPHAYPSERWAAAQLPHHNPIRMPLTGSHIALAVTVIPSLRATPTRHDTLLHWVRLGYLWAWGFICAQLRLRSQPYRGAPVVDVLDSTCRNHGGPYDLEPRPAYMPLLGESYHEPGLPQAPRRFSSESAPQQHPRTSPSPSSRWPQQALDRGQPDATSRAGGEGLPQTTQLLSVKG
jgi:hypothetical protein